MKQGMVKVNVVVTWSLWRTCCSGPACTSQSSASADSVDVREGSKSNAVPSELNTPSLPTAAHTLNIRYNILIRYIHV